MTGLTLNNPSRSPNTSRSQSEMRQATVMMADVVDSTKISVLLEPEDTFNLLEQVLQIVRSVAEAHGGTTINEMGDGSFALFGAPISIDRAALAACRAGLEICEAVKLNAADFEKQFGIAPKIRIGLASGEVLTTCQSGGEKLNSTGKDVNLAARIQSLAPPGMVACSERVVREASEHCTFEPFGSHELRGFADAVSVYTLKSVTKHTAQVQTATGSGQIEFVGRSDELSRIDVWHERSFSNAPTCLIIGEAGLGKSRILAEFMSAHPSLRLILGSCQPSATTPPLTPIIDALRAYATGLMNSGEEDIEASLDPILPAEFEKRQMLLSLIQDQSSQDLERQNADSRLLPSILRDAFMKIGQLGDTLLAFEDLHWIDPLSAEVLNSVIAEAPSNFRMLGTSRKSAFLDQIPRDRVELLAVGPLQSDDIESMARTLAPDINDQAVFAEIVRKSEGNPFFATEILNNLTTNDAQLDAGRIGNIQNISLARFDLLQHSAKALLRMASIQGREFRLDTLRTATAASKSDITGLFGAAQGIIELVPSDPEKLGRFRHILFRDSIYATIPSKARGEMHRATANALEECHGKNAVADKLAEHFDLGGAPQTAVKYLGLAAHQAFRLAAYQSCKLLTGRAFTLIEEHLDLFPKDLIEQALTIRLRCLDAMDHYRDVIEEYNKWIPQLQAVEGSPAVALSIAIAAKSQCHLVQYDKCQKMARAALEMAEYHDDPSAAAFARVVMVRNLSDSGTGSIKEIEKLFEDSRAYTESLENDVLYANRMFHMMSAYRSIGDHPSASALNKELIDFEARNKRFYVARVAEWNMALNAIESNDFETGLMWAEKGIRNSTLGTPPGDVCAVMRQSTYLGMGRPVDIELLAEISERCIARGDLTTGPSARLQMGYAHLAIGNIREGVKILKWADADEAITKMVEMNLFYLLNSAEIYLSILGLIKPPGPTPKIGLGEVFAALRLRLTAKRKAKAKLKELLSKLDGETGLLFARAHVCLGLLAAKERNQEAAKKSFALAERIFAQDGHVVESQRLESLRIDAGLAGPIRT